VSNPHAPRRVSATIKYPESARYANDNPWLVFEGNVEAVREQVIEAFGMEETEGLTLADAVVNAQRQASTTGAVANGLGGTVISKGGSAWDKAKGGSPAPAKPEKSEAEIEVERLTAEVAKVSTTAELQDLWARNQEAFKDAGLMEAYRAKGKSLQAAA
jgi:hypothetical protein